MTLTRSALGIALAAAVISLHGCGAGQSTASGAPPVPANVPALEEAYINVVVKVLPSVVQITSDRSLGSGVIFDTNGDIVTNAHVVGQATKFQVRLADSPKAVPATLVGTYPPDDLAVIKVDQPPPSLHPARFGDSTKLRVGQIVMAMGNPLGLTGSVTNGIVSATGRTLTEPAGEGPGATLPDVIQTSAAVNPGNSGGALVDLAGEVVGIPTLVALEPAQGGLGGSAAPGIGFAIPSKLATDIASQLIANNGHVVNSHRAELGIGVVTVVDADGQPAGVGMLRVDAGGPAAAAGMQVGEVITAVNNTPVHSTSELAQILANLDPGQQVPVTLLTPDGGTRTITVTLGQLPGS